MTDTIVIDFSAPSAPIRWARFNDEIQHDSGTVNELSDLTDLAHDHSLIVWIAGEKVTLTSVVVPTGQQRHLQQVLPSLLEDNMASDIDELHFASSGTFLDGKVNVAAIEKDLLTDLLKQFNEAGLKPQTILPDSLAVPMINDMWSLQVDGELSCLRSTAQMSHVFDTQNMALLLPLLTEKYTQALSLFIPDSQRDAVAIEFDNEWQGEPADKLARLPEKAVMVMNLLQGNLKPRSNIQKYWLQWRVVTFLAFSALLIQLLNVGVEAWQLKQQAREYKSEIVSVFQSAFPDEKRIINPKVQMSQRLAELQTQKDDTGFLMLLQQISPALKQAKSVSLTRLNFERRLGQLRVDVKAEDYAQLEILKNNIAKLNLDVELGSVSGSKGAYTARLMVRGQQ